MIWYLLYLFRGTTEPPRLSASHPLRRAFQAHGTATARHWLLSILLTVVISVLLCYPALFQSDSPAAAGLRKLPKHVWTSTTEVGGDRPADVEMRQIWVHGDYMKALDKLVLRQALYVQNALIGEGFNEIAPDAVTTPQQGACLTSNRGINWGFHSPLMYWNCSLAAIEEDADITGTISARTTQRSALNLTLRPSSVFAGKAFANKKLRAADALVITLFDQTGSSLGDTWEARARQLAKDLPLGWSIFPKDGQTPSSRLYEFHFQPMSLGDDVWFYGSYLGTTLYLIYRMVNLRAVKSKTGLLIAIFVKISICLIASFTVCTYLGIDLARIPRPCLPLVVIWLGLGNILRLINAVLEIPLEMPPVQRIGHALGEVGHLSLAVACQNLILTYLMSNIVYPWVVDFCVFSAVTVVLDFVFHLTFFVAVLSVDVQRMELQDSLAGVGSAQPSRGGRQERQPWLTALRQGNLPVSTRLAGSAAIVSMILAVNWHFFDTDVRDIDPRVLVKRFWNRAPKSGPISLWNPPPINQARTPAEWLKIQDYNTAREMFGFIKPDAHSFIARVYDPLLVVMEGAKGRDTTHKTTSLLGWVRHFAQKHAFPAALIVVSLIAAVTLLMNYLLWSGIPNEAVEEEEDEEAYISVKTLPLAQALDVVRLASCPKGHLVSVSLDRSTSLWLNDRGIGYSNTKLQTALMKPKLWPIVACAMDDGGKWLALAADTGQIGFWSISTSQFTLLSTVEFGSQAPLLFSFVSTHHGTEHRFSLVIVTADGYLFVLDATTGDEQTKRIYTGSLLSTTLYTCTNGDTSLVYVSKAGEVYILSLKGRSEGSPEVVAGLDPGPPPGSNPSKIMSVYGDSSLGLIFAIRAEEVEIFDFNSRALIHSMAIRQAKPCTFRVMHSARRACSCGAPAVHTLVIAYSEYDTDCLIMHTLTAHDGGATSQICLGKPVDNGSHSCQGLQKAKEAVHLVEPAGVWESTSTLSLVGIRKCLQSPTPSSSASGVDSGNFTAEPSALASALKQRAAKDSRKAHTSRLFSPLDSAFNTRHTATSPDTDADGWEAWSITSTGDFRSRSLFSSDSGIADASTGLADDYALVQQQLFVAAPGPIARLGNKSVAVGFGNTVKIISLGKESVFDGVMFERGEDTVLDHMGVGSYKWRARRGPTRKMQ